MSRDKDGLQNRNKSVLVMFCVLSLRLLPPTPTISGLGSIKAAFLFFLVICPWYKMSMSTTTCSALRPTAIVQFYYIICFLMPCHYIAIFMPSIIQPSAVPTPHIRYSLTDAPHYSYIYPGVKRNSG